MRLVTFEHKGIVSAGIVAPGTADGSGERIHPLPGGVTVLEAVALGLDGLLDLGSHALAHPEHPVPLAGARLLPPLQPPTVRDFVAFEEHVEGVVRSVSEGGTVVPEWYAAPTFYFTNPYALVGPHDDVPVPPGCAELDFELEVAAVIGTGGGDLSPQQARQHIVGYTILNDWSARDLQRQEMRVGLGPAKGKDSATTLGPWLVTADEVEPFRDDEGFLRLRMSVAVNGVEVGRDLLSNMGWPFEELVAYASRGTQVRPGDVLGSGTCGNGGCLAELWGRRGEKSPPPLRPGDVVTMTVEGIGTISNRVVPGRDPIPLPPARPRPRDRG
jgi:2-keto-4-pentenoate hydratase/2-oxohepta-3-ene-1,7-dioic acid hydratase in catechol pathway